MTNSGSRRFTGDHVDRSDGEDLFDPSETSSTTDAPFSSGVETSSVGSSMDNSSFRGEVGLTERLTDILVEDGDGDLLLQRSDREDRVLQWLQALDMQVMGACRVDERLKPLLKANVSGGVAEDRLLAHLSQHFEPSEVGILARCFCIPLVSIRVGKINKQGTLLCPTTTRGNLSLMLLPTSDLRLSFIGDDGRTEKLSTLSSKSQCAAVEIKEIPADNSGRSFLVKVSNGRLFYFWCSEKSKLLGIELLSKMKDIISKKPSVAELTGISESRLGCFATQLRVYLAGSVANNSWAGSSVLPLSTADDTPETDVQTGRFSSTSRQLRARHLSNQALKSNSLYQASLSPRPSSFKEGLTRNLSSLRTAAREKLRKRGDSYLAVSENLAVASIANDSTSSNRVENESLLDVKSCPLASNILESLGEFAVPPILSSASKVSSGVPPLFSSYYCWCPPNSMQCMEVRPEFPTSSAEPFSLPPLSSLLPASGSSSLLKTTPSLDLATLPPLDLPALLPDPLVHLPMANTQQIPTFTPFICDPIVHIPVIDVCSSGQGYLVSAGPTISTSISPLHPKLVGPLLPETDSALDKSARETLRLLISGSAQNNAPLLDVLPAVLTSSDDKPGILVMGSRGLYSGTRDVNVISEGVAAMGLASNFLGSSVGDHLKKCDKHDNLDAELVGLSGINETCSEGDGSQPSNGECADL